MEIRGYKVQNINTLIHFYKFCLIPNFYQHSPFMAMCRMYENFESLNNWYLEDNITENQDKKKTSDHSKVLLIFLTQRHFSVHELPPLLFKKFSVTMHYYVMSQMILQNINLFTDTYFSLLSLESGLKENIPTLPIVR